MRILSGDETGLLKFVDVRKKRVLSRYGVQSRDAAVAQLCWPDAQSSRAASQTKLGVVEVWDTLTQQRLHRCTGTGAGSVLLSQQGAKFLTVNACGDVRVFDQGAADATDSIAVRQRARYRWLLAEQTGVDSPANPPTIATERSHPLRRSTSTDSSPLFAFYSRPLS